MASYCNKPERVQAVNVEMDDKKCLLYLSAFPLTPLIILAKRANPLRPPTRTPRAATAPDDHLQRFPPISRPRLGSPFGLALKATAKFPWFDLLTINFSLDF
jgi:hypothetical protein